MTLSPAFLDELRARTSLSALIGRTVKLQRAGREWKALCPFHKEKTASFYVVDDKQFYHCQGCAAHGDAIRWLTDARGLSFMDAVKELADAAGLDMPAADPRARERDRRAASLRDVIERAAAWYQQQLVSDVGADARAYLARRGFTEATIERFGLGYAPDARGRLRSALQAFGTALAVEAGLLVQPEGREPYDRFRGRLMIPIRDPRGRTVAFSARTLTSAEPKYLNSPETPLFDKGRMLFNLDRAGPASRRTGRLVAVEGCLDVIALDQAGLEEAVAPLGTAVTAAQLELLWRYAETPLLCLDGDGAGQAAAVRTAARALPHVTPGRSLGFVQLPPGQDPDSLVRDHGRRALDKLLEQPQPLAELLWLSELQAAPIATPEARAGLRKRLMDLAGTVSDSLTRAEYRRTFHEKLAEIWRPRHPYKGGRAAAPAKTPAGDVDAAVRRSILVGLARFPAVVAENTEAIAALPFIGAERRLADQLLERAYAGDSRDDVDGETAALVDQVRRSGPLLRFAFTRPGAEPEAAAAQLLEMVTAVKAGGRDARDGGKL